MRIKPKLKFVFIVVISLITSTLPAQIGEQRISISFSSDSYIEALNKIADYSVYTVIFSEDLFNDEGDLTMTFENEKVETILNHILQNTELSVKKSNSIFIISKKKRSQYNWFGYIVEKESGERLAFATVHCVTTGQVFESNETGYFSISLPPDNYTFNVHYLGHEKGLFEIPLYNHVNRDIGLASKNMLPEIIVDESKSNSGYQERNKYAHDKLMRLSTRAPGLGGSSDLLQTAKSLPGIQSGATGGYFIRGGSNDQNLYLLDGVAIYNPFHSLGLTSIFTPHATRSLQIYKSGFRAQYGDKSSSVIDIKLKDGHDKNYKFGGGVNPQDGYFKSEGPLWKGRSSFFMYGRASTSTFRFNEVIKNSLFPEEEASNRTNYFDLIAKVNFKINTRNELFATFYKGKDLIKGKVENEEPEEIGLLEVREETELSWGNQVINLRLQSILSPSVFLHLSVSQNKYFSEFGVLLKEEYQEEDQDQLFFNSISSFNEDMEYKAELDIYPWSKYRVKTGLGMLRKSYVPNFQFFDEDSEELDEIKDLQFSSVEALRDRSTLYSNKWYAFIENTWTTKKMLIQAGLRTSYFAFDASDFFHLQPRLSLDYFYTPQSTISISASRVIQYVHLLSGSEVNLPRDLWYPAYDALPPEETWHYNLAFKKSIREGLSINTEIYLKDTRNKSSTSQIAYEKSSAVESLFGNVGKATSYGFEIGVEVNTKRWESLISYTLSKSTREFSNINLGNVYDFQFDRVHELKSVNTFQLSKSLVLGLSTYLASGHPLLVTSELDLNMGINPIDINEPGYKNQKRTSWQHRLDLSLLYSRQIGRTFHDLKFNIYNSYSQNHPLFYTVDPEDRVRVLQPNFSIPIIPSLSYSISF